MNDNRRDLIKVDDEKAFPIEVVDNNDWKKSLNYYKQILEQHTSIDKSFDKQLNLQDITLSKLNQIRNNNNDAIRYNLAIRKNDFLDPNFFLIKPNF